MRRRWVAPVLTVAVGGALCGFVTVATSMSGREAVDLAAIAGGTALVAVVVGAALLHVLRSRAMGVQIATLTFTTAASLMAGCFAAAEAMFLSEHDLLTLLVVLLAAATVGISASLALGDRFGRASARLAAIARTIGNTDENDGGGDGEPVTGAMPDGAPRDLAEVARDLAAMEQRLIEARRHERALEASRRELVAWVSHDLRTPLAGIRAIVEALEDRVVDDPDTVAHYYSTLRREADDLAALVDDLFELSRTRSGALDLKFERVTLGDLVSDALAGSGPVAQAKGVRLEGRVVGPPAEVDAAAPEVLRVLRNLLENAIRHTPSDGSVVVEAGVDNAAPDRVFLSVLDCGGGVPAAYADRIFDVAFQGDASRSPGGGAGLGLAIAKGFVEAHRGEITVTNDNGGARFTVLLPREQTR